MNRGAARHALCPTRDSRSRATGHIEPAEHDAKIAIHGPGAEQKKGRGGNRRRVFAVRLCGNETGQLRKEPAMAYSEIARETSQPPPSAAAFAIGIAKYPLVLVGAVVIIAACRLIIG